MIKKNAIANYIGRAYILFAGIGILPLYMEYLGAEAYGLVGLFTFIQSWIQLFNFGLAPALGREAAKSRAVENGGVRFFRVLASFEIIFFIIVVCFFVGALSCSEWISVSWLKVPTSWIEETSTSIALMICASALRFQTGLYRSGLMGLERQVFVNLVDVTFVSFRFLGGMLIIIFLTKDVVVFFGYQLIISAVELVIMRREQFTIVATLPNERYKFYCGEVKSTLPFAMGVAYTAGIWVLITQVDKALLTSALTLREIGYYSIVTLMAGGIIQISQPLSEAIRPRLTSFAENRSGEEVYALYLLGTQLVAALCLSITFVMIFNSHDLIYAWTGSFQAAKWGESVLIWFLLGNGILSVASFQYYLQFAYGRLKLHVVGSTVSAFVQIPVLAYAALNYGALGAAKAWFAVRLFFFIFWVPIVHKSYSAKLHRMWMFGSVVPIMLLSLGISAAMSSIVFVESDSRLFIGIQIAFQAFVTLVLVLSLIFRLRKSKTSLFDS